MTLTLMKAMRRRNEALHNVDPNNPPNLQHRSRSQETFEDHDDVFKKLDKRYLSQSSSSTDTDDCSATPNFSRTMTDPIVERTRSVDDDVQTLPLFPFSETHDKHCWSEPDNKMYSVRGPTYLQDSEKVTSGPYLLRARGADLLLTSNPSSNVGRYPSVLGGTLRSLPTFIFKFRFPWGVLPMYFEIPASLCPYLGPDPPPLDEALSPSERTLAKFFVGSQQYKNDTLKMIPHIPEGPWVVRNLVSGKPAIIGNKLPVTYMYVPASDGHAEYLEADLDVGSSSATAKRIVSMCRRYMNLLTVDIGLVIQGNCKEELPEQMLGSIRLHCVDAKKGPTLDNDDE